MPTEKKGGGDGRGDDGGDEMGPGKGQKKQRCPRESNNAAKDET